MLATVRAAVGPSRLLRAGQVDTDDPCRTAYSQHAAAERACASPAREGAVARTTKSRVEGMLRATSLGPQPKPSGAAAFARYSARTDVAAVSGTGEVPKQVAQRRCCLDRLLWIATQLHSGLDDELLVGLLPDFDTVWRESTTTAEFSDTEHGQLVELRVRAERAVERCLRRDDGPHGTLRLCVVTLFIEAASAVPESQLDCALSCAAARAASGAMPYPGPGLVCAPSFFRYQDLMAMPLSAVHAALVSAAHEAGPLAALQRLPLQARPAARRCTPNYLRFVVGISVAEGGAGGPNDGLRLPDLEQVVRSALLKRLGIPVGVSALGWTGLYGPAHHGLRTHQAARLRRIVAGLGAPGHLCAFIALPEAGTQWRARLTLTCDGSCVAACMLQMPLDETSARLLARLSGWLSGREIQRVHLQAGLDERKATAPQMLAEPI
jgi:hypothetical protein